MDKSSFLGRLKEIWRAVTAIRTVTAREVSPEDNDRPLVLPRTRGRFSGRPQPPVIQAHRVPSRNPLAVNVAHSDSSHAKGFRNHQAFPNQSGFWLPIVRRSRGCALV